VPLRAGVENPQHRLEDLLCRNRLGADDRRACAPPESASGSAPTVRPICVARTDLNRLLKNRSI
jgi:hypothetical protein